MLLVMEIPVGLGWIAPPTAAYTLLGMTLVLTLYSVWNAYSPSVVKVELSSHKLTAPLRFSADHRRAHGLAQLRSVLERVMQQVVNLDIDFLCITGDFIDAPGIISWTIGATAGLPRAGLFQHRQPRALKTWMTSCSAWRRWACKCCVCAASVRKPVQSDRHRRQRPSGAG
ncbi:MAG: hypothetical protein IPG06_24480 [Haliea sp.]|nr:hypothetical protein [Haliea sp.]